MEEEKKKRIRVITHKTPDNFQQRKLFVANEPGPEPSSWVEVEYEIDEEALTWAERQGGAMLRAVHADIERHFLACLSEVVGKRINAAAFMEALKTGWI